MFSVYEKISREELFIVQDREEYMEYLSVKDS